MRLYFPIWVVKTVTLKDTTKTNFGYFSTSTIICWIKLKLDLLSLHYDRNVWKLSSLLCTAGINEQINTVKFFFKLRGVQIKCRRIVLYKSGHAKRPQDHQKIKLDCNSTHSLIPCSVCQFKQFTVYIFRKQYILSTCFLICWAGWY